MVKVPSKLSYSFCDSERELGNSVTKETLLTLLSCNYYCCFMLFSRSSGFVVFWSDTCNYGLLPLEVGSSSLCLVSCPLSLCQCPGSVFTTQGFDSPITRVLFCWGHSWEGLMGKGFVLHLALLSGLQNSFPLSGGNWSHSVKFHLVNTFWLKESNSIKVFVKGQIYLPLVLRIMPKPFVLNNKKVLNWRKAFNRIELEQGS